MGFLAKPQALMLGAVFGTGTWEDFARDWLLGAPTVLSQSQVEHAIAVWQRVWPRRLRRFVERGQRGLLNVAMLVQDALLIEAVEGCSGFDNVLRRFKKNDVAARSEMIMAAALIELGYKPHFEPTLGTKGPDLHIQDGRGENVAIEVVSPRLDDLSRELQRACLNVAQSMLPAIPGHRLEAILEGEPDAAAASALTSWAFAAVEEGHEETVVRVRGVGTVLLTKTGEHAVVSPLIPNPDPRPAIFVGSGRADDTGNAFVLLRAFVSDERAGRLLASKRKQLKKGGRNIVVMDLSSIPTRFARWAALVSRSLTSPQNTRVSAVVLMRLVQTLGKHPERRWYLVANPHASKPLDEKLIQGLSRLAEPWEES